MALIQHKRRLNPTVTLMEVSAPLIAKKAQPGQFIILRVDEHGERIPLTISDYDRERGTVTIIFQKVGLTTELLDRLEEGDDILDFVGPLGTPTDLLDREHPGLELGTVKRVAVIGGGVGCAIAYPQAKYLHARGVEVDVIAGFRSKDIVILEEEFKKACDHFYLTTDDGSCGEKGLVTDKLKTLIDSGIHYDAVIAIGPIIMMKFVCKTTEPYGIKTLVSLNPIMIDGTGMCGGCRVSVGGEMKFACVDGPDFDGHKVDFDELMTRNRAYQEREAETRRTHACRLMQKEVE
ncbi:sulfide/dihydroorotate dehydrogenase-like FAD/NAD-binding protein [Intestinimonas butyriciproducens]|uniref:sulfide/dihydroorotate dehydrogenase-like FAD/NAD-binding protein n=1 Tax=Intestinimonas butyriciproducens TaxID=1297617 RepID=UPI001D06203B|nr:sulfide/dihydroorotate dehydrogenase-like FAD/NAD-binding protein [Intestinimonas butyriciproducens]MCB7051774.1 sulfide/dihydroorotate dehydrogenase-like FAD/NAD-binding protein [Intestinimonas butyriciproducens]